MPEAVGVIQTIGFPGVLAAADAMVKGGEVTLVTYQKAESGQYYVAIRGNTAEVRRAVDSGLEAVTGQAHGAEVLNHYIVPNPPENIVSVLATGYSEESEPFR
ncbi:MAG: carbon dioxide-concentrating mechanism protein CcmK [Cyanobacteria bacterium QH_8_48_120]|jgi:microcompartment protein CcmL/EutN|nr:MAG: carbon dioxide-concentrating mechanism protein CcmK [Cyanobacteria bacterium QH_1_48_107]PSO61447.1 MAG: carbon dioxide-concentrating mechanism protein CcmK [Cyanobacteria bacterium QH_10_48_56]PSO62193.1 MAG: carbon dioxide-concentrating mechanism protein CcmK [Cyanobacteria bacterium QH_2_48_84]PSO64229.1 MAG: carbon dioxide-concentrating mechanism protein CcmK [Cyanobacteria bacterium QH_7_48_89]PSO67178.1 MAG: carbon dioxide-concentrating mechanism protein CcmK [Cyanobacteria bacter